MPLLLLWCGILERRPHRCDPTQFTTGAQQPLLQDVSLLQQAVCVRCVAPLFAQLLTGRQQRRLQCVLHTSHKNTFSFQSVLTFQTKIGVSRV